MAIRVRATDQGFIYNRLRQPGDKFLVRHPWELGSWMEVLEDEVEPVAAAKVGGEPLETPEPEPGSEN